MKPISLRRFKQLKRTLNEIYSLIPSFECKEGCHECCGPTKWSLAEWLVIREYLREHGRHELFAKSFWDKCPYLQDGKCSIYEVRPLICRLFGVVDDKLLRCPYVPAKKYVSKEFVLKLKEAVVRISSDLLSHRKITAETRQFVEELKRCG